MESSSNGDALGADLRRRVKADVEIVLLCNPRAGGRWKELGEILDSEEAQDTRRIVTDSVHDLAPALSSLTSEAKLLCIYGGDGTIQRILDRMSLQGLEGIHLALIGGGTMNVTARWCGMRGSPDENFRAVARAYADGSLLYRQVTLLEVRQKGRRHRGFTFGMGTIVRVLDAYERGRKGKLAALATGAGTILATFTGFPRSLKPLVKNMPADIRLDGERLPDSTFSAVFANVTGEINPGVAPFAEGPQRDTFNCAAYSVEAKDFIMAMPMLMRGWLPRRARLRLRWPTPWRTEAQDQADSKASAIPLENDPRYVNRATKALDITTNERLYTVDGELFDSSDSEFSIRLGPTIKLAVLPKR